TSILALGDGHAAGILNRTDPFRAVFAHSRHDDADSSRAKFLGDGMKKNVGRRAMAVDGRSVGKDGHVAARHAADHHVAIAGTDENAACNEEVPGFRFLDVEFATFIEALGEHFCKAFRHVLDDEYRSGKISGNLRQQKLQRVGATGGNSDRDDAIGWKCRAADFLRTRFFPFTGVTFRRFPPARLATFTFSISCSAIVSRFPATASLGFATKSIAPRARALNVE